VDDLIYELETANAMMNITGFEDALECGPSTAALATRKAWHARRAMIAGIPEAGFINALVGMAMTGFDLSELMELALLLVAAGGLAGFLAAVFGIGGGAVLVPVFYECFRLAGVPLEVRMPLCEGRPRDVEAYPGDRLRLLSVYRWRPLCDKPDVWSIARLHGVAWSGALS